MTSPSFNHPPRIHARYICRVHVVVLDQNGTRTADGWIINISQGGAMVYIDAPLTKGTPYQLKFSYETIDLTLPATPVRDALKDPKEPHFKPTGMRFLLDAADESRVKLVLDQIRRKRDSGLFDKMQSYW